MSNIQCPLLRAGVLANPESGELTEVAIDQRGACLGCECAFWADVYTIETIPVQGCAIKLLPSMNNGRMQV